MSGRRDRYTFITPPPAATASRPRSSFFPDDDDATLYPMTPTSAPSAAAVSALRLDVEGALVSRLDALRSSIIATAERDGWSTDAVDELLVSVGLPKWTKEWRVVTRIERDEVVTVRAVSEAAAAAEVDANTPFDVSVVSVVQAEESS